MRRLLVRGLIIAAALWAAQLVWIVRAFDDDAIRSFGRFRTVYAPAMWASARAERRAGVDARLNYSVLDRDGVRRSLFVCSGVYALAAAGGCVLLFRKRL